MTNNLLHSFHIPVLGISYSIDTPIKVARFGISSVLSIMDDELIEKMRQYHCDQTGEIYDPIEATAADKRARRITAYLNLCNKIVNKQLEQLRQLPFAGENDLTKYFEMLPAVSALKTAYLRMKTMGEGVEKNTAQKKLKNAMRAGAIDVNIMAKIDKINFSTNGEQLPQEYSDALSAFRGFANSDLASSVVFSAGYNPHLYNYIESFKDFYPDEQGYIKKKIILKVSDYRSALVQGKLMAKKGLWVSEFRIESGLNCGGHAFATDGLLLGVILEDFKNKRCELASELLEMCNKVNAEKGRYVFNESPEQKITVQGGIGTANENNFLQEYYMLDGTGLGSPFLLVPEATNVDEHTLLELAKAKKEDYYISGASPLGVPFNNFKKSTAEKQRLERIDKGRPGSPCYKKHLVSNTEFTDEPICTASREYQQLKIKQLKEMNLPTDLYDAAYNSVIEKDCLCEGLGAAVRIKDHIALSHKLGAVAICPGPNLAYFSGIFSLSEMVAHIYGEINLLNATYRPNMFVNELVLYVDYLKKKIEKTFELNPKQVKYFKTFKDNLIEGINYYKELIPKIKQETNQYLASMKKDVEQVETMLNQLMIPELVAQ